MAVFHGRVGYVWRITLQAPRKRHESQQKSIEQAENGARVNGLLRTHLERSVPARFRSSKALSNRLFSVLLTPNAMHVATSCLHNFFTNSGGPGIGTVLPRQLVITDDDKTLAVQAMFIERKPHIANG